MADGIDFHQRKIAMLDNAIQVRREQAHRAWQELRDQIALGGDHRSAYLQRRLLALNMAVIALGELGDQREAAIAEHGPGRIRSPQKIGSKVVQLNPDAWRE